MSWGERIIKFIGWAILIYFWWVIFVLSVPKHYRGGVVILSVILFVWIHSLNEKIKTQEKDVNKLRSIIQNLQEKDVNSHLK